jgi:pimeloyl-ACP methyl ester carboxylesterase
VCGRVPVRRLVLVAAMIPTPGALAAQYWTDAGYPEVSFDEDAFYHDLSPDAVSLAKRAERPQQETPMRDPSPLTSWPRVPTHYVLGLNDRVFPESVTRRVVRSRLGIEADEIESGHCVHLARPTELAQRIDDYLTGVERSST